METSSRSSDRSRYCRKNSAATPNWGGRSEPGADATIWISRSGWLYGSGSTSTLLTTPNTPAVSLFYALGAQLDAICRETIEARWERHTEMARRTWEWADEMKGRGLDIRVLAPEGYRSTTVTCLTMPAGHTGSAVTANLKKRGFTIASGYGALKDATIRIGHMGDHTVAELDVLLAELDQVLAS